MRRRRNRQEQLTAKQKALKRLEIQTRMRADILRGGIAAVLSSEQGFNVESIAALRHNLTELEDATAAAQEASDAFWSSHPYRWHRSVRVVQRGKKATKKATGKKAAK
jgi:hypothetical protein